MVYSAKAIKLLIPKLKKDDFESYIVWNRKFTANLVFINLSHVINANYMSQALPPTQAEVMNLPRNHYLSVLVCENDQVMAFFNKARLDNDAAIVLEEAKVEGYEELGLAYICHNICSIASQLRSS